MSEVDRTVTAVTVRRTAAGHRPSRDHLLVVADVSVSSRGRTTALGALPAVFVADDGSEHAALPGDATTAATVLEPYTTHAVRVVFDVPRRLAVSGRVLFAG